MFASIDPELPALTRGLIAISDFLREQWPWLVAGVVVLGLLWVQLLKQPPVRAGFHRVLHRTPLVAKLFGGMNTARFARTFSILAGAGVPILEALRISAEVMTSIPMRNAVQDAAARVREGASIRLALERSRYFNPMTLSLIASGEAGGNLEEMLERAAANQERELETLIAALLGIFEPTLILAMGGMVVTIVLAILLPIFELNQLVG